MRGQIDLDARIEGVSWGWDEIKPEEIEIIKEHHNFICMNAQIYACMYIYTHICRYTHIYADIRTYMYFCIYTNIYADMRTTLIKWGAFPWVGGAGREFEVGGGVD